MSTKKIIRAALALGGVLALAGMSGCATVVYGEYQVVAVETRTPTESVSGVTCKLQNKKGIHYVTTPASLSVYRDYGDMVVTCEKPGLPTTTARFKSKTRYATAGNILLPIGAVVDTASGAAYSYPAVMQVTMDGSVAEPTTSRLPYWLQ